MEVPLPYIDFMTDTASTNVKWLDVDEAKSLQGFSLIDSRIDIGVLQTNRRSKPEYGSFVGEPLRK